MTRIAACRAGFLLQLLALYLALGLSLACAQVTSGDVSASVPEAGTQALAGALAAATVESSSGVMKATLPLPLPGARGKSQPALGLTYSSAAGVREAGVGWGLSLPVIERSTKRGAPNLADYLEKPRFPKNAPDPDELLFNGARLVPICEVGSAKNPCNLLGAEPLPGWALGAGTRYYRLEIDSHARFFWAPGRATWRVQLPGGEVLEFGRPEAWTLVEGAGAADPDAAVDYDEITKLVAKPVLRETVVSQRVPFRWNLVRRYDPSPSGGAPKNVVFYRWTKLGSTGLGYLTDVYYSPPANIRTERARGITAESFAHHVRLAWEFIPQAGNRYTPTWRAKPDFTLARIDVASKRYEHADRPRELVRRFHLSYKGNQRAYLQTLQMEGRCEVPVEEVNGQLPPTACKRRPPITLRWSQPEQNHIPTVLTADPGFPFQPPKDWHLIPLDVNADGLPDLVETNPAFEPNDDQGNDAFGTLATTTRRVYIRNDIFFEEASLKGPAGLFSGVGYSITGDYAGTGRTGAVLFAPVVRSSGCAPEGPCQSSAVTLLGHAFAAGQGIANAGAPWNWVPDASTTSAYLSTSNGYQIEAVGDVNGDGVADIVDAHSDNEESGPDDAGRIGVRFGQRRSEAEHGTSTYVAGPSSCVGPSRDMMRRSNWGDTTPSPALADMNGDGLPDLVVVGPHNIEYWPGDGRSNFSACRGAGCTCSENGVEAPSSHMLPPPALAVGTSARGWHLADVNGDGYADLTVVNVVGVNVYLNIEGFMFSNPISVSFFELFPSDLWIALFKDPELMKIAFADMNGNGVTDLLLQVGGHVRMFDLHRRSVLPPFPFVGDAVAPRPGLLVGIDNGLGAKTEIAYTTTAELARSARAAGKPWSEEIPQVMQVVSRMTTSTGVPGEQPTRIAYTYDDPSWDGFERRFRGFRSVTTTRLGSPALNTRTTYFIPVCPLRQCWSTDTNFLMAQAASGAPLVTETFDDQGQYLSTVSRSYNVVSSMSAVDGRPVRFAYPARVDTRLYDTNNWTPADAESTVQIAFGDRPAFWTGSTPIRSRTNVLLRSTQKMDAYGNSREATDYGRIKDDGAPIDDPIVQRTTWLAPRPDWKFLVRKTTAYPFQARPLVPADHLRERSYTYDAAGRLKEVTGHLVGTLPLDRRHESGALIASPPASASKDGQAVFLEGYSYDAFDNVIEIRAPNGRCSGVVYDSEFGQLPEKIINYRSGCGFGALTTIQRWDRGMETANESTAPNGTSTSSSYDGFGRPLAIWLPEPGSGQKEINPSMVVTYDDVPGGPVQRTKIEMHDAPGRSRVAWAYFDGVGQPMLTLTRADPAAGDGGAWVVDGLPLRGPGNLVIGTYQPWFYDGDPANHPLVPPSTGMTALNRDAFGRIVETRLPDGTLATSNIYWPLSQQTEDGAGRWTRTSLDGHGRQVEWRTQSGPGVIGPSGLAPVVTVETTYQVGAERARVVQSDSVSGRTVTRWMQYDSLGRMVLNAEPNTAVGFDADPTRAVAMHAWRYAYNDAGDIVATSDARGCGENFHYDKLGRLLAEDYSPCLSMHAPYTPHDVGTRAGAEAFYQYDTPEPGQTGDFGVGIANLAGRLVASVDRASHTRFAYDWRGQDVGLSRQLARPSDIAGAWPGESGAAEDPFASHWFRRAIEYDKSGRPVSFTTGAESAGVTGLAGMSRIDLAYSGRGLVSGVRGSYGILVDSASYESDGRVSAIRYGDAAHTLWKVTYDSNRRLATLKMSRQAPALWTVGAPGYDLPGDASQPTTQEVLAQFAYKYDTAGLLAGVVDQRAADEWPVGAKPVTLAYQYDSMARLKRADYLSTHPDPAAFIAAPEGSVPEATIPNRTVFQTFAYDARGNISAGDDDVAARYDRSLGATTYGSSTAGPDQLRTAGDSTVSAEHDAAGNLINLVVARPGPCSAPSGRCTHRFVFDWDEVGRLGRTRRWDYSDIAASELIYPTLPAEPSDEEYRYRYAADGSRILKSAVAVDGTQRHNVDVFETLRLEGASYDDALGAYERTGATEVVIVPAIGRVVNRSGLPRVDYSDRHVLLELTDHLGSTAAVLDYATGELIERTTYQAYGAIESDYRPARWGALRGTHNFTGKEPDAEGGIIYFGARYYQPHLGRWMSADPRNVHGFGGDLNPYAYVSGKVTSQTDPDGLDSCVAFATNSFSCEGSEGPYTKVILAAVPVGPTSTLGVSSTGGSTSPVEAAGATPIATKPFDPGANMSAAQRYIWGGSGTFHDVVTSDTFWAAQQYVYGGIALGAATVATGGLALEAAGLGTAEGVAATAFVNAGRAAQVFTELSLAEQGIVGAGTVGGVATAAKLAEAAEAKAFVNEVRALAGKRGQPEQLIRYGSEAEAVATKAAGGLVPRPGHTGPKRVAEAGARIDPRRLGSEKSYSHRIDLEVQPGTTAWLRRWSIEGEPGRYAIPADQVARFNALIRALNIERVR